MSKPVKGKERNTLNSAVEYMCCLVLHHAQCALSPYCAEWHGSVCHRFYTTQVSCCFGHTCYYPTLLLVSYGICHSQIVTHK